MRTKMRNNQSNAEQGVTPNYKCDNGCRAHRTPGPDGTTIVTITDDNGNVIAIFVAGPGGKVTPIYN